ncbi:MAG: CDP-diacylglycerol--glycerol-3-phosphate 3-phosphatidyltransferase, partial [Gammaproteobacteria bacterium]|nr:CDP-diacylglycerol--glycerol-3-phosphate 3-phosphatidyltransferase [Gammaproteobacteria bacterium]
MEPTLPNILTWLRIALIPVFVLVFYLPTPASNELSALVFALAGATDWLDGYFARRLKLSSPFGAFLDPVADKLMVAVVLILLVEQDPRPLLAIPAAVIVGREIVVSALREWMAELGKRTHVAVSIIGKVKTLAQMIALLMLLYRAPVGPLP